MVPVIHSRDFDCPKCGNLYFTKPHFGLDLMGQSKLIHKSPEKVVYYNEDIGIEWEETRKCLCCGGIYKISNGA